MKKHLSKIFALVLALAAVLSISVICASAAPIEHHSYFGASVNGNGFVYDSDANPKFQSGKVDVKMPESCSKDCTCPVCTCGKDCPCCKDGKCCCAEGKCTCKDCKCDCISCAPCMMTVPTKELQADPISPDMLAAMPIPVPAQK